MTHHRRHDPEPNGDPLGRCERRGRPRDTAGKEVVLSEPEFAESVLLAELSRLRDALGFECASEDESYW